MRTTIRNTTAMILVLSVALAVPALARDVQTLTRTFDASPGQKLEVNLEAGGSLSVEGWDKKQIRVDVSEGNGNLSAFDVRFNETRGGLEVKAELENRHLHSHSLHVQVMAPRRFDIEVHTAGGALELKNLEGEFTGKTMGGSLDLEDLKGEARLTTMGGAIRILDCELDGKVHTMGGRVLVENLVGNLRASSNGGNVVYKNVTSNLGGRFRAPGDLEEDDLDKDTVLIYSMGGGVDVDEAPDGASIYTGGGDVMVRNASRFVDAKTGGGEIEIDIEEGWVKAWTGAGDVDVTIKKETSDEGDVIVFTGMGDVSITVPRGFSMTLDLDIGYTRQCRDEVGFKTNLDFKQEHTDEWDYEHGTPRKHILGTGSLNGGKHKITVRTTNGNIRLMEK